MRIEIKGISPAFTRRQFIGGAALSTAAFMVVPGSVPCNL